MGLEILKRKKFNGDHSFRTQGCKTAKTLRRKTLTVVSFLSTHDKSIPDLLFGMLFIIKNISLSLGES